MTVAASGRRRSGADRTREQRARGFVGRVLRDEAALEGGLEDRLSQPRRVCGLGVEQGLRVGGGGEGLGDAAEDFGGFCRRRDWHRSMQIFDMLIDAKFVVCLPSSIEEPSAHFVGIVGNEIWVDKILDDPDSEHVILMDHAFDFATPNPAPANFVAISAFVEQQVARDQSQFLGGRLLDDNRFDPDGSIARAVRWRHADTVQRLGLQVCVLIYWDVPISTTRCMPMPEAIWAEIGLDGARLQLRPATILPVFRPSPCNAKQKVVPSFDRGSPRANPSSILPKRRP